MGKYFGTDGFRGEAGKDLTSVHAWKIGRFLGWYFGKDKTDGEHVRVVIGKDTRRSCYMYEYSIAAGLTASGADVYILHVTTTPSVSYITRLEEFDCGVMISASHNAYMDNGIKLINRNGEKMEEDVLLLAEAYLDGDLDALGLKTDIPYATGDGIGRMEDYDLGRNRYMGYLMSVVRHSLKGLRIGLDCANGSAWRLAPAVFNALGAKTYVINAEPDGLNINRDAGSTHIEGLRQLVTEKQLDVGFAFDGDADRCLAVDEKGNIVTGDHILYLFGVSLKKNGKLKNNTVVTTVMSNLGLYRALAKAGIDTAKTAVGDKYVYENMVTTGTCVGGEQSGPIILSKYATTGDGILTALQMVNVMLDERQPLSALTAPVVFYPQVLKNIRVTDKAAVRANAAVTAAVEAVAVRLGDSGRILVRESGTEPLIRVMVECESEALCSELADSVIDVIRQEGLA